MFDKPFSNRAAAGRALAALLSDYRQARDVVVVGLPRGGVPVASEVARSLGAPLDVLIVRKLGAPGQPELAVGAIASGGITVINEKTPPWLRDSPAFELEEAAERTELQRRERLYRRGLQAQTLRNRSVILVDDGSATGSSMLAAVRAARQAGAHEIVVALPVASDSAFDKLRQAADRVVCICIPTSFAAVGDWYEDFTQTSDAEVTALLAQASNAQ